MMLTCGPRVAVAQGAGLVCQRAKAREGERVPTQAAGPGPELGMLVRLDRWKREGEVAGRVGQK